MDSAELSPYAALFDWTFGSLAMVKRKKVHLTKKERLEWVPKPNEHYYFYEKWPNNPSGYRVSRRMHFMLAFQDEFNQRVKAGNVFRTKKEADSALRRVLRKEGRMFGNVLLATMKTKV